MTDLEAQIFHQIFAIIDANPNGHMDFTTIPAGPQAVHYKMQSSASLSEVTNTINGFIGNGYFRKVPGHFPGSQPHDFMFTATPKTLEMGRKLGYKLSP